MNKKYLIPAIVLLSLTIGFCSAKIYEIIAPKPVNIFEKTKTESPGLKWVKNSDSIIQVHPFRVEGELFFAGERVPLEDAEVRERLDRELQINVFRQSNTVLNMKLANRYFNEIEKVLQEEGVPSDFKYLPLIESDFRDVVSPSGAAGFWQFISSTGKRYGLEINDQVDERYNIEKATRAACVYLKDAKTKLGSWTLAAAAYNYGTDGVQSRLKTQHGNSYYDLAITSETARYVFRMLAMKVIFTDPRKAGYNISEEDLYQPHQYSIVSVDSSVSDLVAFAEGNGVKYKHLKMLNSWMRAASLPNKAQKTYQIKILK